MTLLKYQFRLHDFMIMGHHLKVLQKVDKVCKSKVPREAPSSSIVPLCGNPPVQGRGRPWPQATGWSLVTSERAAEASRGQERRVATTSGRT